MGLIKLTVKGVKHLKDVFHKAVENDGILLGKPIENAYMTDLLQAVINKDIPVYSVPVSGGWVEVDTVDDLNSTVTRERLSSIKSDF